VSDNKALLSTMNQRDALFPLRIPTKHNLLLLSAIMKIQTNNLPSITMVKLFTTNQASALVQDQIRRVSFQLVTALIFWSKVSCSKHRPMELTRLYGWLTILSAPLKLMPKTQVLPLDHVMSLIVNRDGTLVASDGALLPLNGFRWVAAMVLKHHTLTVSNTLSLMLTMKKAKPKMV
jgi:hypothetical protein